VENLKLQAKITNQLILNDPPRVRTLLEKFEVSGFFTSKDIEISQRSRVMKILAFIYFSTPKDALADVIPQILERIVEFINYGGNKLKRYAYFFCRHMFYKTDPNKISIIWPTIVADITSMFESICNKGITKDEYPLLLQMIKFLELIFLLNINFTVEMKWACVKPYTTELSPTEFSLFYFEKLYDILIKANEMNYNDGENLENELNGLLCTSKINGLDQFVNSVGSLTKYQQDIDMTKVRINKQLMEDDMLEEFVYIDNERHGL